MILLLKLCEPMNSFYNNYFEDNSANADARP